MLFLANQELRPRLQPPPCWLLGKLSDVAEAGGSLSFRRRQSLPSMGAPSNVGCSGREQEGAGLTDTQSPGLGLTHRQESFAFSHGGRGRVPRSTTPKLVPRSMYVCVSRSPGCAWGCHSTGAGTRGGVLGAAGSAQPISPRAKTHSPCPHPAAGPPHSPWGLRHHRPLSPPPVALPAYGVERFPSLLPNPRPLRSLSNAQWARASHSARAWSVLVSHPLLSLAILGRGACCSPPAPGGAGGSCGVLQGRRMLRGAHTRRRLFGTGWGRGQGPEG